MVELLLDDDRNGGEYVLGGLEDENGAAETAIAAEHALVGALIWHPTLARDLRELVHPDHFFDRVAGGLFAAIASADCTLAPENEDFLAWLGPAALAGGAVGAQALGYLRGLGADVQPSSMTDLALEISDAAERRFTAAVQSETFLVGETFKSKMGLLMWAERNTHIPDSYDYLVEDTIPERELTIIMGATQAGKSFLAFHLAMCMARAVPFFGRQILEPVPVVWLAYEGGRGARGRMLAYAKHHNLDGSEFMFAALTRPFDLWSKETNVDEVIKEIEGIVRTEFAGKRPGAIFIDTHNAATPGASEIDSEAVSKIRDRYKLLIKALGCAVVIIGHTNALGKHRGNELLVNNVDTVITVTKKTVLKNRIAEQIKDDDRRDIRSVELVKQREGETGHLFDFVLPAIETGVKNKFGKSRTSCVVTSPNWTKQAEAEANVADRPERRRAGVAVSPTGREFLRILMDRLFDVGERRPASLPNLPADTLVVNHAYVRNAFKRAMIPEPGADAAMTEAAEKQRWTRATRELKELGVIGFDMPFFWWTGKEVQGVKETRKQAALDFAPPSADEFPEDR